jgi:hypothetical protein
VERREKWERCGSGNENIIWTIGDLIMDRKKDIIQMIATMSGKYSGYEIFTDWIVVQQLQ